jgi:hypothetical protein
MMGYQDPFQGKLFYPVACRQGLARALQPSENGLYVAFYEAAGRVKSFVLPVGALSSSCFC